MAKLSAGDQFPAAALKDIDSATVEFSAIFAKAPASIVLFYRRRW
jgi:peroxiredoxin